MGGVLLALLTLDPLQCGPPVINGFLNPLYNYSHRRIINHSEIGVIGTNLAIVQGINIH